jgi:hypothetical protein
MAARRLKQSVLKSEFDWRLDGIFWRHDIHSVGLTCCVSITYPNCSVWVRVHVQNIDTRVPTTTDGEELHAFMVTDCPLAGSFPIPYFKPFSSNDLIAESQWELHQIHKQDLLTQSITAAINDEIRIVVGNLPSLTSDYLIILVPVTGSFPQFVSNKTG